MYNSIGNFIWDLSNACYIEVICYSGESVKRGSTKHMHTHMYVHTDTDRLIQYMRKQF